MIIVITSSSSFPSSSSFSSSSSSSSSCTFHRLALELHACGMIEAIVPVLVGDFNIVLQKYGNYFTDDCHPRAVPPLGAHPSSLHTFSLRSLPLTLSPNPLIPSPFSPLPLFPVVTSVEQALVSVLTKLALGPVPLVANRTVASVLSGITSHHIRPQYITPLHYIITSHHITPHGTHHVTSRHIISLTLVLILPSIQYPPPPSSLHFFSFSFLFLGIVGSYDGGVFLEGTLPTLAKPLSSTASSPLPFPIPQHEKTSPTVSPHKILSPPGLALAPVVDAVVQALTAPGQGLGLAPGLEVGVSGEGHTPITPAPLLITSQGAVLIPLPHYPIIALFFILCFLHGYDML